MTPGGQSTGSSVGVVDVSPGSPGGTGTYPKAWEADVVLRDGGTCHLRPIRPDDEAGLIAFHSRLSETTVYYRFFAPYPRLSDRDVERFTHVDYRDRAALVATIGDAIIGVVRYDRVAPAGGRGRVRDRGRAPGTRARHDLPRAHRTGGARAWHPAVRRRGAARERPHARGLRACRLHRRDLSRRGLHRAVVRHHPDGVLARGDPRSGAARRGVLGGPPRPTPVGRDRRSEPGPALDRVRAGATRRRRRLHRNRRRHQPERR